MLNVLVAAMIGSVTLNASAQQGISLTSREIAIKRKADALKPHAKISVILLNGPEQFGAYISNDTDSLTFQDVDRKTEATVKYSDIKKLKEGYGGYNSFQHRHTDRSKAIVVAVIVLGVLGGLIAAATMAKN